MVPNAFPGDDITWTLMETLLMTHMVPTAYPDDDIKRFPLHTDDIT